jgi:aryl-alcohol dehydrogenase-like predicted oxidoreductase
MRQRTLGTTNLKVSTVGLGCNNFGLRIDTDASRAVIHKALDLGITFFDTADVYGHRGGSETCLGQFLGARRKDIVLASKFGNAMDEAGTLKGASRRYITTALEASLKRLKTDWIDIYQLHRYDPSTPLEETMGALDDLIKQGKIRYAGVSSIAAWRLVDMQWTARHHSYRALTTCEVEYSLLARDPERELIPAMQDHGMGLLPYYPLASGFLTGKYRRNAPKPEGARLTQGRRYEEMFMTDTNWTRLERLEAFCKQRNRTLLELAFSWLAAQPVVACVIAGATLPEQLEANVKAADWELTPDDLAEIDRICPNGEVDESSQGSGIQL